MLMIYILEGHISIIDNVTEELKKIRSSNFLIVGENKILATILFVY